MALGAIAGSVATVIMFSTCLKVGGSFLAVSNSLLKIFRDCVFFGVGIVRKWLDEEKMRNCRTVTVVLKT